ncbi:NADH dehydrogenase subunit 2 (mitochondrion) [Chinchilla lanigera]|uniref:NADH-ubiquinone oxidoreductase chain 2 n=1 Tax=Chinchilla lanigera TaxID=34839 RepID=M9NWL3_CHILA|nr:NADH dehydrogenase subunit 2 [Chinchilla lanigera]AFQ55778.1 NADH dehydrogenase subunit 2 [Chinchilla lanigera]
MNLATTLVIYPTLFMGTIITLLSSHWLLMWIGLEMSMLAVIPILMGKANPRSTEAATKYFMTQATASMALLMSILLTVMHSGQWTIIYTNNQTTSLIMTLALLMKLGLAPFHFWVPEVTQGVCLKSGMILLTWQKIAPLSILFQISPVINQSLTLTSAIMSILLGGWGGLNQTQLRKILAYSSIAHMGWMLAALIYNPSIMLFNLIIYIVLTLSMFLTLSINNNSTTLSLSLAWSSSPLIIIIILLPLLSLGGLPPLTGFSPKWVIIQEMVKNNNIILPTFMSITALLSLYFYLQLTYSTSLTLFPSTNNTKTKWHFQPTKKIIALPSLITLSTLLIPLTPSMIILN